MISNCKSSRSRVGALLATVSAVALVGLAGTAQASQSIDNATVAVPGTHPSPWTVDNGLTVGVSGTGELDVTGGGLVNTTNCAQAILGQNAGSTGTISIDGVGSTLDNGACGVTVGQAGTGVFSVSNGGALSSLGFSDIASATGSHGTVTLTGAGSIWTFIGLSVGDNGTGTVNVNTGTTLLQSACGAVTLGNGFQGVGMINVAGAGAHWTNICAGPGNLLTVGADGTGVINVSGGGVVTNAGQATLGQNFATSAGTLWVSGVGSKFLASNMMTVGAAGTGTLTIASGGLVSDTGASVGGVGSSASVDGAGSTWTNIGSLNVGTGNLSITNNGLATSTAGSFGTGILQITGAGSAWTMTADFSAGSLTASSIGIASGGLLSDVNGTVANGSNTVLTVLVDGAGSAWKNSGALDIGGGFHSNATVTIQNAGSVSDTTGDLEAGLISVLGAGSTWTSSGTVYVGNGGTATLDIASGGTVIAGGGSGTLNLGGLGFGAGQIFIGGQNVPLAPGTLQAASLNLRTAGSYIEFNHSSSSYDFSVPITGIGQVVVTAGTTTLSGASTYSGSTLVDSGVLLVSGSLSNSNVAVQGGSLGGSGSIAGLVSLGSGSTLLGVAGQTLTMGQLILTSNVNVDVSLGAPSTTRLFDVNGALTLAGNLNVTDAGGFGPGIYRLIDYTGALTDNGLVIGTTPAGVQASDLSVQTGVAGQVNLAYSAGAALQFWNGSTLGPVGSVVGGAGTWKVGPTNWTDANGTATGAWTGGFAIFTATPGAVTIDNGGGAVSATGLQFAADGYSVGGGTLTLTGPNAVLRVGEGTPGGGNDKATISAVIAGVGFDKTDGGRLILTGANTFTGPVGIAAGTLTVSADDNLGAAANSVIFKGGAQPGALETNTSFTTSRAFVFTGSGGIQVDLGSMLDLTGAVTGSGALYKVGAGVLQLSGASSYSGAVTLSAGTLQVDGSIGGAAVTVNSGATLAGSGSIAGSVAVVDGGILKGAAGQTLTMGSLSLTNDANINVSLGAPSTTGLFAVNGALTLDGKLNVTDAGGFGVGLYRLIDYTGALTDSGLTIGTAPAGVSVGSLSVQTSVANQVNLVYAATGPLQFWNGSTLGPVGSVVGGAGTWKVGPTNWSDANGAASISWSGGLAIFGGVGGAVTIDNGGGAITASDLQFTTNGYSIGGGALTLTGAAPTIRVGDGTPAGVSWTATINSVIAGSGGLTLNDLGSLILGGANTYTGGTNILNGTLLVSSDANLGAASGGVTFNGGGELVATSSFASGRALDFVGAGLIGVNANVELDLSGPLSGSGAFTKYGAGVLVLSGSGAFDGATTVHGGTLQVDGVLGGAVLVQSGARLQGTGTVGSATIASGATLAPGHSIGTLTVAGSLTLAAGSTYEVQLNAAGQSDLTHATGAVTIQGGVVNALSAPGLYSLGAQYTILTADGGRSGTFTTLQQGLSQPFLQLSLAYDPTHVYLDVTRNSVTFCQASVTRNQCAAANGAESLGAGNTVYDAVANLPDVASARRAFDLLSGEVHASVRGAEVEDSRFVRDAALGRLGSARQGEHGAWVQVFDTQGSADGDGNAANLSRSNSGVFMGVDTPASGPWRLGAVAGYSQSRFDAGVRASSANSTNYHLGAYGSLRGDGLDARFGAAFTWHDITTGRGVAIGGFSEAEKGGARTEATQVFGEIAYPVGGKARTLEPFAGVAYVSLHSDGFTEQGGAAALRGLSDTSQTTFTTVGLRVGTQGTVHGAIVSLSGALAWRGAYGDVTPQERLMFASGGAAFTVAGAPLAANALVLNADLGVKISERVRMSVAYMGQLSDSTRDQGGKAALTINF